MKTMQSFDQLQRRVQLPSPPQKIISLVPSVTELLCDIGLQDAVAGVTKFCVHPSHIRKTKTVIGGTKNLHIEKIKELKPDLIFASKEENVKEQIEELEKDFPVWVSDVKTFDDALQLIESIGKITDTLENASHLLQNILEEKNSFQAQTQNKKSVIYLIWENPYMTVGGDTFIHTMLQHAGFSNMFSEQTRYPELSAEQMQKLKPELVLLSSEPYPFKEKHRLQMQKLLPASKVLLADGELFSWYGSRIQHSFRYFAGLHKFLEQQCV